MKNAVIGILVLALAGLGGWAVYDKTKSDSTPSPSSQSTTGSNQTATDTPTGAHVINLSGKGLTKVGSDIYGKTDTTTLILSNNGIQSLPSQMGNMTRLQVFKIDHNKLDGSLIGEIRKMPLKTLDVSYNNMTGIPAEIGQLNQLETLDYSYNHIDTYPNEIANLTQLKTLNLTGNQFSAAKIAEIRSKLPNTNVIF